MSDLHQKKTLHTPHSARAAQEVSEQLFRRLARFVGIKSASGLLLFLATVAALLLSNSPWSEQFLGLWETQVGLHFGSLDFTRSLRHWINEGLMTLFFFVVSLELKHSFTQGNTDNRNVAALSLAGAVGGMLVPAALYVALMPSPLGMNSWGTVVATDTAFAISCLALLGSRLPASLRLFLLSLAIFDDVGAILVVAFSYGDAPNGLALGFVLLGLVTTLAVALIGIRSAVLYFLLAIGIWLSLDISGINPTLGGVALGLMTSTHGWISNERLRSVLKGVLAYTRGDRWGGDTVDRRDLLRAGIEVTEYLSPVERLEITLHPWVSFVIMPLFAFANAGVTLSGADAAHPAIVAIFLALVLGKPAGVLLGSWLAVRLGLARKPADLKWRILAAGALLTGIGFTMSLFIADLAYSATALGAAKIGILAGSFVAASAGVASLFTLSRDRVDPSPDGRERV